MKRFIPIVVSLTLVIIPLLLWAQAAERNTFHILKQAGLTNPVPTKTGKSIGAVHFENIKLDPDNASTIKSLKASYSLENSATFLIEGLDLTGDTLENKLAISGVKETARPFTWATLPIDKIIFQNSRLAILTGRFGGINLNYDALITRNDKDTLELQTRFSSKQNNLSLSGQATGQITPDEITLKGELEHFKLNTPNTKLSRSNGSFTLSWHKGHAPNITIKTQSGGAQILGLPWKNVQSELSLEYGKYRANTTATALEDATIQLAINRFPRDSGNQFNITLLSSKAQQLKNFLSQHNQQELLTLLHTVKDDASNVALIIKKHTDRNTTASVEENGATLTEEEISLRLNFP